MSDYTVKREKEGILRIQAEGTKMPGPLTINERDYADDKQLIVGGGSSSPIGLAKVEFVLDNDSMTLEEVFNMSHLPVYDTADASAYSCPTDTTFGWWNGQLGNTYVVTPQFLPIVSDQIANVNVLEGDAEIISIDGEPSVNIKGDCTIEIKANGSRQE